MLGARAHALGAAAAAPNPRRPHCARSDDWALRIERRGAHVVDVSLRRRHSSRSACGITAALVAAAGALLAAAATSSPSLPAAAAALLVCVLLLVVARTLHSRRIVAERVLAVRGLGITASSERADGSTASRTFVDAGNLRSVLVSEAMQGCDVRFHLACIVAGHASLLLPFEAARPRLPVLAKVYRELSRVVNVGARAGGEEEDEREGEEGDAAGGSCDASDTS